MFSFIGNKPWSPMMGFLVTEELLEDDMAKALKVNSTNKDEQITQLDHACEHYTEACRVSLDLINTLHEKLEGEELLEVRMKLEVVENILHGAVDRHAN